MKKVLILIAALAAILITVNAVMKDDGDSAEVNADYLRIHIRANSDSEEDQAVKYEVKEAVIEALTPELSGVSSKKEAMKIVSRNLSLINEVCEETLASHGFSYGAQARLCQEDFPARNYGELTLESGIYDALIVDLGSGDGDNWWCVVFPPLCFVAVGGEDKVTYKSLFAEWFHELFG